MCIRWWNWEGGLTRINEEGDWKEVGGVVKFMIPLTKSFVVDS